MNHNIVAVDENSNSAIHIPDGAPPFVWENDGSNNNNSNKKNGNDNPINIKKLQKWYMMQLIMCT